MVNLLNDLPNDYTSPEEEMVKLVQTLPNPPKQSYDYIEDIKSRSHTPKFHSTYTVIPRSQDLIKHFKGYVRTNKKILMFANKRKKNRYKCYVPINKT